MGDDIAGTSSRVSKRPRECFSPESPEGNSIAMDSEKVGDMTRGQLVKDMLDNLSVLLDSKLSALATKEDVFQLSTKIQELEEENRNLRVEVRSMKDNEKIIMGKLVDLEGRSRRNNLIFRGLKLPDNVRDYIQHIKKFCAEVFGNSDVYINRAHPLDRERKAIIAHLPYDNDVEYIMTRVKQLKNTGYSVQRDFPREVREKRVYLAAVREEVERVAGRRRMPLVYDHLGIENVRFTWEDCRLRCGQLDGAEKLSSLFRHDFSKFLAGLRDHRPVRVRQPLPPAWTNSENVESAATPTAPKD